MSVLKLNNISKRGPRAYHKNGILLLMCRITWAHLIQSPSKCMSLIWKSSMFYITEAKLG